MKTARDVMRTGVLTVPAEATLGQAVDVLLKNQISGLPVVDQEGHLVGIISEFALLAITYDGNSRNQQVRDHMTTHVIQVDPDTPLTSLADTFILHRIRRIPVTDQGKLLGMVSRRELLRAAYESGSTICEHPAATTSC